MEDLEKRLDSPDWKQWIPIYGVFKMEKDLKEGKPTFYPSKNFYMHVGFGAYHYFSLAATIIGIGEAMLYFSN